MSMPYEGSSVGHCSALAKRLTAWTMIVCLTGCTTLRSVDGVPADLQKRIVAGTLLKRGDRVVIHTNDGSTHELVVEAIREGAIQGNHESIPLETVVAVHKREFSAGKTLGLVAAIVALGVLIGVVATSHVGYGLSGG